MPEVTGGVVKVVATAAIAGAALFGPATHARADSLDPGRTYAVAAGPVLQAPYAQPANGNTDVAAVVGDQYQWDGVSPSGGGVGV
jgi:hypothetical protein